MLPTADGGTRLTLMGADGGQSLAEGLHYTCRFGNAGYPEDVHAGGASGAPRLLTINFTSNKYKTSIEKYVKICGNIQTYTKI